jgi:hypothetical protein
MNSISLRQFVREPTKYLINLPIVLTQYGDPVAIVDTYSTHWSKKEQSVDTSGQKVSSPVDTSLHTAVKTPTKPIRGIYTSGTKVLPEAHRIQSEHEKKMEVQNLQPIIEPVYRVCSHGSRVGLCRYGCK